MYEQIITRDVSSQLTKKNFTSISELILHYVLKKKGSSINSQAKASKSQQKQGLPYHEDIPKTKSLPKGTQPQQLSQLLKVMASTYNEKLNCLLFVIDVWHELENSFLFKFSPQKDKTSTIVLRFDCQSEQSQIIDFEEVRILMETSSNSQTQQKEAIRVERHVVLSEQESKAKLKCANWTIRTLETKSHKSKQAYLLLTEEWVGVLEVGSVIQSVKSMLSEQKMRESQIDRMEEENQVEELPTKESQKQMTVRKGFLCLKQSEHECVFDFPDWAPSYEVNLLQTKGPKFIVKGPQTKTSEQIDVYLYFRQNVFRQFWCQVYTFRFEDSELEGECTVEGIEVSRQIPIRNCTLKQPQLKTIQQTVNNSKVVEYVPHLRSLYCPFGNQPNSKPEESTLCSSSFLVATQQAVKNPQGQERHTILEHCIDSKLQPPKLKIKRTSNHSHNQESHANYSADLLDNESTESYPSSIYFLRQSEIGAVLQFLDFNKKGQPSGESHKILQSAEQMTVSITTNINCVFQLDSSLVVDLYQLRLDQRIPTENLKSADSGKCSCTRAAFKASHYELSTEHLLRSIEFKNTIYRQMVSHNFCSVPQSCVILTNNDTITHSVVSKIHRFQPLSHSTRNECVKVLNLSERDPSDKVISGNKEVLREVTSTKEILLHLEEPSKEIMEIGFTLSMGGSLLANVQNSKDPDRINQLIEVKPVSKKILYLNLLTKYTNAQAKCESESKTQKIETKEQDSQMVAENSQQGQKDHLSITYLTEILKLLQ